MPGSRLGLAATQVALPAAAVVASVGIENFTPVATLRHSQLVPNPGHGGEIAHHGDGPLSIAPFAQKSEHATIRIVSIDPFEPIAGAVALMECRLARIEPIQVGQHGLEA